MKKRIIYYIFVASVFALITFTVGISSPLKSPTGKISGHISDIKTGDPIPDANIIINKTPYGTASGDEGYYCIEKIPKGTYDITVKVVGYKTAVKKNITIKEKTILDFKLCPMVIPINPIVVTATRTDHLKDNVSSSSEILISSQFQELNGSTAGEIVKNAGGLLVKDQGGFAGLKTLSIRGSNDSQVLVLLDDQRLNTAQSGGVDLNTIPIEALERIEIIRGGHSALFGTDAVGGVIHLITNEAVPGKKFSYGIRSMKGSFGMEEITLFGSQKLGSFSYFTTYNLSKSKGNFEYILPQSKMTKIRKNNDFKGNSFFFKSKLNLGQRGALLFTHQSLESNRGVAGSVNFPSPQARRNEQRNLYNLGLNERITSSFQLKSRLYSQKFDQVFRNTGIYSHHINSAIGISLQTSWTITPSFTLINGEELRKDRLKSTDVGKHIRTTHSIYMQAEIKHPLFTFRKLPLYWRFFPAFRWDSYSDVKSQICPELGFVLSSGKEATVAIKANLGKSFRVPSFNDLYWPEDAYTKGNPYLKPETSTNFDIGLLLRQIKSSLFQIELTYFKNNITDLIVWDAGPDWKWTPQNIGKAKIFGFEHIWTIRILENKAYFKIVHTWMKAIDETPGSPEKGSPLIYRPKNKIDINTGFKYKIFHLNFDYRFVGKRRYFNYGIYKYDDLNAYHLLNGNLGCYFSLFGFNINTRVEVWNIMNKSIYIIDGYPIPRREFRLYLGIKY